MEVNESPALNEHNATSSPPVLYEQNISFLWDIKDFTEYDFKPDEYITSSRFYTNDTMLKSDWKVRLYPIGSVKNSKMVVVLMIDCHAKAEMIIQNCEFSILNSDKEAFQELQFELMEDTIADLESKRYQIYSLNMRNLNFQRYIYGGTLSVLCKLNVSTRLHKIKPTVRQEVRMWSTTTVMKQCSTIAASVTAAKQTSILEYGRSFVRVQYHQLSMNKIAFELLQHPEIDNIWCSIDMIYHNRNFSSDKIHHKWSGQLNRVRTLRYSFPEQYPAINLDFILSTHFVAMTPKDSFPCNFISANQQMQLNYKDLLLKPTFGDVSIHVGDKILRAHKDILAARSDVFEAMFSTNMLEASTGAIIVTDLQFETMHAVLKHIYYGMTEVNGVDIAELLKAAAKYNLSVLQRDCELILCDYITMDNVMGLMILTDLFNAPMLKNSVISFMRDVPRMQYN